jgi:2-amino-4-hydroxy-6-hydroxymethyldihydropteridine diphosphokinase
MATTWLGLGGNVGDRERSLAAALDGLRCLLHVDAVSPVYESPPFGFSDQPAFLNLVVRAETALAPRQLLVEVKALEERLGRVPTFRMGPRIIDVDILLYDDVLLDEPGLVLPHPGIPDRAFVLVPLLDIDATVRDPATGQPYAAMLDRLDGTTLKRLGNADDVLNFTEPGHGA